MSWGGGPGRGAGAAGSTCSSSMSCGMAPTIWMAIFTTSLGGGMAPRIAASSGLFPPPPPPLTKGPARPGRRSEAWSRHPSPGRPGPLT